MNISQKCKDIEKPTINEMIFYFILTIYFGLSFSLSFSLSLKYRIN